MGPFSHTAHKGMTKRLIAHSIYYRAVSLLCSFKDETKKKQEKNKTKETEKAVRAAGDTKLYIRRKQKSVNLTNIK